MLLNDLQIVLGLIVFAGALYFTWQRAYKDGYSEGYQDACVDVAHGHIIVKLGDEE